jgi:hypothetical protein
MKNLIKSYSKISECNDFWSWLYWAYEEPAEIKLDKEGRWFKYCGSNWRRVFIRFFGFELEYTYYD